VVLVQLGGCALVGSGGTQGATCVSWVWFESPADALTAADVVVRTDGAAGARGTVDAFGVAAAVHTIRVAGVLQGPGVEIGDQVDVVSTPVTCTGGGAYPDGDPLDAPGDLVLLLHRDEDLGAWRTLTPGQGAVPPAADGGLPSAWPAASTAG
jgi:hypothetical protein